MLKKTVISACLVATLAIGVQSVGPLSSTASAAPVQTFAQLITLPTFFNGYYLPYSPGYRYVYDTTWIKISARGQVTTYFSATVPVKIYNASGVLVYDYIIKVGNG